MRMLATTIWRMAVPVCAALALASCGQAEEEERTLDTSAEDLGGGDFIVSEEDPDAVPVDTPDVPMTPVPQGEQGETAVEPATGPAEPAGGQ